MRVLYVNQTAQTSGAEHSLLTLVDALPAGWRPVLACPPGALADAARDRGVEHRAIRGTDASFRLHPTRTPRALAELAWGAAEIRRLVARERPDVVHANTARAGLLACLASAAGGPPLVVSFREPLADNAAGTATQRVIGARAAAIVPNSAYMAGRVPVAAAATDVHVVHNAVDVRRFGPAGADRPGVRAELGLADDTPVVGVVGQLTPWKGQLEAIEMLALLRRRCPEVVLLVVGSAKFDAVATRWDNRAYAQELRDRAAALGLGDAVRFVGERSDVPAVMSALDVLVMPSWWEAFGRVAVEGMALGLPVVASSTGGAPELLRDGHEGRLLAPRDPAAWADAVGALLDDPGRRAAMGRAAAVHAREAFSPGRHAARMVEVYEAVGVRRRR